jgi:hypothetical protein
VLEPSGGGSAAVGAVVNAVTGRPRTSATRPYNQAFFIVRIFMGSPFSASYLQTMLLCVQHHLRNGDTRFMVASMGHGLMESNCEAPGILDARS